MNAPNFILYRFVPWLVSLRGLRGLRGLRASIVKKRLATGTETRALVPTIRSKRLHTNSWC